MGGGTHGNGQGLANTSRMLQGHDVWGQMCHYRGVVMHHLSPFEQRVFAGWFSNGFPNIIRRTRGQLFNIGTPILLGLMIYNWAESTHNKLIRKDPQIYINEYTEYLASPEYKAYLEHKEQQVKEAEKSVKKPK